MRNHTRNSADIKYGQIFKTGTRVGWIETGGGHLYIQAVENLRVP